MFRTAALLCPLCARRKAAAAAAGSVTAATQVRHKSVTAAQDSPSAKAKAEQDSKQPWGVWRLDGLGNKDCIVTCDTKEEAEHKMRELEELQENQRFWVAQGQDPGEGGQSFGWFRERPEDSKDPVSAQDYDADLAQYRRGG